MTEPIAILNGRALPASQAAIPLFDSGFVHAAAVADFLRTFRHVPFRLDDHLARLQRGVEALGVADAPTLPYLKQSVAEVVAHNGRLIPRHHDLGLVAFVTAGGNATYLGAAAQSVPRCTWGVHSFPLPFELWAERMRRGQQLVIPARRHVPPECFDPTVKWRNRLHWFLAERDVRRDHPEASALLLDHNSRLTETATANLFLVQGGRICTPSTENTLDGVSRRVVFELADALRIPCEFADLTPADAYSADEAFTSTTTVCLMPVAAIDGKPIGRAVPGPVYRRLIEAWNELAGINIIEQIQTAAHEREPNRGD